MSERVYTMPSSGRLVVAAPGSEKAARYAAFELGLPYLLDPQFEAAAVFMVAIGRLYQLEHEWLTLQEASSDG